MTFHFRPAVRENVGIFIGLAGESGSGKTWSAMALATGIVPPGQRFAVIDTENKRALHYADDFAFDVLDLSPPYTSERYRDAVKAAFDAGYKAIVVDSVTHEHDGEGGYLDRQQDALAESVKRYLEKYPNVKEWDAREKLTPSSWIAPKRARKEMMYTMLACSSTVPIIFCFRAEEKVFGTKDGKLVAHNPPKWQPICGKGMPFEMTVSFIIHAEKPGYPIPIKLPAKLAHLFPLDKPINEESGRRLAEWARGASGTDTQKANPQSRSVAPGAGDSGRAPVPDSVDRAALIAEIKLLSTKLGLTKEQRDKLSVDHLGAPGADMNKADVSALSDLLAALKRRS